MITIFNELYSINHANKNNEVNTITSSNNNAILVSKSDHSAKIETLYLQQNSANAAHLKQSMEQLEKGELVQVWIDK